MVYDAVISLVDAGNRYNVLGFERQLTNNKKLLTVAERSNEEIVVKMFHLQYDSNVASHCHYPKNVHLKM